MRSLALLSFLAGSTLLVAGCGSGIADAAITRVAAVTTHVASYTAFGDSITYGYGVNPRTLAYPFQLGALLGLGVQDAGIPGDQACDVFPRQIVATGAGFTAGPQPLYSIMIGTNDMAYRGPGPYQANYRNCLGAALTFLALRRQDKVLAGDAGWTATGGCTSTPQADWFGGGVCTADGTFTAQITTGGPPLYLWYGFASAASGASQLLVQVDGAAAVRAATQPAFEIGTLNGTQRSIGYLRLPVAAGTHTVVVRGTAGASLLGVGTLPAAGTALPEFVVGDIPHFRQGAAPYSQSSLDTYRADLADVLAQLRTDGIALRFAPTEDYLSADAGYFVDGLHPNASGQQKLEQAFASVLTDVGH